MTAILRDASGKMHHGILFDPPLNGHHDSQTEDIPYALGGSFIGIFSCSFGLVFTYGPGQSRGFAFQAASDLLSSIRPGVGQTLSSLDILESPLGLLNNEGTGYFDQVFGQAFSPWVVTTGVW